MVCASLCSAPDAKSPSLPLFGHQSEPNIPRSGPHTSAQHCWTSLAVCTILHSADISAVGSAEGSSRVVVHGLTLSLPTSRLLARLVPQVLRLALHCVSLVRCLVPALLTLTSVACPPLPFAHGAGLDWPCSPVMPSLLPGPSCRDSPGGLTSLVAWPTRLVPQASRLALHDSLFSSLPIPRALSSPRCC